MAKERLDPNPSSFVYSLRSVGYSLETAIADIIDNSIAAGATDIQIFFKSEGDLPVFAIIDNGHGMSPPDLKESMRLGSTSPLTKRRDNDLGRFGLGMKTASFSICKRLSVVSTNNAMASAARWDLDDITENNSWDIEVLSDGEIHKLPFINYLQKNGTAIVWEKIDRMIDVSARNPQKEMESAIATLEKHLQLTFHRYLDGERGVLKTAISINGHPIESFDPFNAKNSATQVLEEDIIPIGKSQVCITPYILPHHSKTNADEYDYYAGEGGYLANQGFYVYRNKRLIVHGTWFRLAAPENLTKLARVKIDIPNDLDKDWNIDVKKSTATPPAVIRDRLKATIEKIMGKSAKTYKARGRRISDARIVQIWEQVVTQGKVCYKVNPEHPLVVRIREKVDAKGESEFMTLLDMIARCFPTDLLFSDYGSKPNEVSQNEIDTVALADAAKIMVSGWIEGDRITHDEAIARLARIAPFNIHFDFLQNILEKKK
jgi:hypothetical protein